MPRCPRRPSLLTSHPLALDAPSRPPTIGRKENIPIAPCYAAEPAEAKKSKKTAPGRRCPRSSAVADANIRVGVGLLDKLMDLVGELVLTRNQILQFNAEREDAALNATSQRLNLITTELQEGVMKTRMQPIGMVWNKLPRVVRDMAVALGKQIRLRWTEPRPNSTGPSSKPSRIRWCTWSATPATTASNRRKSACARANRRRGS